MGDYDLVRRIHYNPKQRRRQRGVEQDGPAVLTLKNGMPADVIKRERKRSYKRRRHA
jgi:hypothetical protein